MRAYRARQKAGLMVFPVEADWVPIAKMLIANGLLPAGSADDRVAIEPWGGWSIKGSAKTYDRPGSHSHFFSWFKKPMKQPIIHHIKKPHGGPMAMVSSIKNGNVPPIKGR
jgi:hypothetical protein